MIIPRGLKSNCPEGEFLVRKVMSLERVWFEITVTVVSIGRSHAFYVVFVPLE